jgi:hypothetical protein
MVETYKNNRFTMKRIWTFLRPSLLVLLVLFTSCSKDDSISQSDISSLIQEGTWKVVLFKEDAIDETSNFTNYEFTFMNGGTVNVMNGGSSMIGTWATGSDDSNTKLVLLFTSSPLEELSEDWQVLERTATVLKLQHISGGSGDTDLLTFQKI